MATPFDPYHRWLGIRPEEQPADHYRLLGLARFEDDVEVIRDAAERQIAHLRRNTLGTHAELARQLLTELGQAKACLTDHAAKARYDASLIKSNTASPAAVQAASNSDVRVAVPNADLESQRRLIVKMYESQQWREANSLLEAMRKLTQPATVQYAKWAEQQLDSLHALLQQKQQAAAYILRSARELFANQEYGEAAQKLLQVDKQLRTPEINQLLDKAMELQEEVDQLIAQIEFGLRDRMRPGTLRNVQRLLQLKPKDRVVRDLYRKFRWQTRAGSLGLMLADALTLADHKQASSMDHEPFLRKWLALAALVGLLAFGLTSWGLLIYLRHAKVPLIPNDSPVAVAESPRAIPPDEIVLPDAEEMEKSSFGEPLAAIPDPKHPPVPDVAAVPNSEPTTPEESPIDFQSSPPSLQVPQAIPTPSEEATSKDALKLQAQQRVEQARPLIVAEIVAEYVKREDYRSAQIVLDRTPLLDRKPFDVIILDKENRNFLAEVQTITTLSRPKLLESERKGKLQIRFLYDDAVLYEVEWIHVARVEFFENLLFQSAQQLVGRAKALNPATDFVTIEGLLDEASRYYTRLKTEFPKYPGLEAAIDESRHQRSGRNRSGKTVK
jgi:hypothetical protein